MNELNIRKGPELQLIIPAHAAEFEEAVLYGYERIEGLPIANKIIPDMNLKFIVAGYMGMLTGDKDYYITQATNTFSNAIEEEAYANWKMKELATNSKTVAEHLLEGALVDVQSVLHHYYIFHGGPWGQTESGSEVIGFFHTPTIQVW